MTRITVTYAVRGQEVRTRHLVSSISILARAMDWAPAQLICTLTQEGEIRDAGDVRVYSIAPGHEQICVAVPYPMTGGASVPSWGIVCPEHPTWFGSNVATDFTRASAEAFGRACACGHPSHARP